jgi:hypothetical protein
LANDAMDGILILRGNPVGGMGIALGTGVLDAMWRSIMVRSVCMTIATGLIIER